MLKKTKLTELENKIPDASILVTKTTLTAVESKRLGSSLVKKGSSLVKKTDYRLTDHNHDKYITTSEFNTLDEDVFDARVAQANWITKTDFDAKLSSLDRKTTENKSENLLVENELNKLKTFDSSYFIDKSHFEEDGT